MTTVLATIAGSAAMITHDICATIVLALVRERPIGKLSEIGALTIVIMATTVL